MNPAALSALVKGDIDNFVTASTPGGIEAQEAQGQRQLVASEQIPKEIIGATREQLTALGFEFGADVDELFVACKLPAGWSKRASNHSMHSDLVDDKGRVRAGIFYKAAFYDRRADMRMNRRFNPSTFEEGTQPDHYRAVVKDGDQVVAEFGEWHRKNFDLESELGAKATEWLDANKPEWRSVAAYWD
jgi:hypothetical protein